MWFAGGMTVLKLWLTRGQPIYGLGPAIHDDRLFAELAIHLVHGDWLGSYNQLTLAKGPGYPLFLAANFWLGLPLGVTQQLLYALACGAVVAALLPWLRRRILALAVYALLLWNPMSFEGPSLTRLMRQNLTTPLVLFILAGLIGLYARRHFSWRRQIPWAAGAGLAMGVFWLTREEGVWLIPGLAILGLGMAWKLRRCDRTHLRNLLVSVAVFLVAWGAPIAAVSCLNYAHYGWFGTVEFRAPEFNEAYGALTRINQIPVLSPAVVVSQQMRERAYSISPAFAELRPQLEGPVGEHWADHEAYGPGSREIRGGWFMWALRDAVAASGHAPNAKAALAYYRRIADEINAACDAGRVPSGPRCSGYIPTISRGQIPALLSGGLDYFFFFIGFDSFSARTPDSTGDYAELLPLREITRDRLSFAPRDPTQAAPSQDQINAQKISCLDSAGRQIGGLYFRLIEAAHLVGLLLLVEAITLRRASFLLWLAGSAWTACMCQLAINTLVHVTSFEYKYPAAMAPSYPLMLLFSALVAIEATNVWVFHRQKEDGSGKISCRPVAPSALWCWAAGVSLLVLAGRLREIHLYSGDVAINDQWKIEAMDLLLPWLNGTLQPWSFIQPHFEHVPIWTRLLSWVEVALSGQWDPLLQTTVNSLLYAVFASLVIRWLGRSLRPFPLVCLSLLILTIGVVPHAWENSTWGFQSQFPCALLFLFLHADGSFRHPAGTAGWWRAQMAGVGGLFTLASMWMAPFAVLLVSLWTQPRGSRLRWLPAMTTAAGLIIIGIVRVIAPPGGAFAQTAGSPLQFLHALLDLLSWPAGWPGSLVILNLPLFIFSWQLRGRENAGSFDRAALALGLWSWGQAAALAFARSADYSGYVSRYGDLLAVGIIANGIALARLIPATYRLRPLAPAWALAWVVLVVAGLNTIATTSHAAYFHGNAVHHANIRRDAIQAYLRNQDRQQLETQGTRWLLYQDVNAVISLLDRADFRNLLPQSVNPSSQPSRTGKMVRRWHEQWLGTGLTGGLLSLLGLLLLCAPNSAAITIDRRADFEMQSDPWLKWTALGIAVSAFGLMLFWPDPVTFEQNVRWSGSIRPAGSIPAMTFTFAQPSSFPDNRLIGAAPISPPELRNLFCGTAPEGPALTGTILSSRFKISTPWLVVPHAGYPVSHGNGLRIRIEESDGRTLTEIGHQGPNPQEIAFWTVDVRQYAGRTARLVLYDGRTGTDAWVAAAPPIATGDPSLAVKLADRMKLERLAPAHLSLGWTALAAVLLLIGLVWTDRFEPHQ